MLQVDCNVVLWLIVWAFIGSTLGFFTVRYKMVWSRKRKQLEYLRSVCVGIFFALPIYFILSEHKGLSQNLSITLAGSSAFAITDFIIKLWPKLMDGICEAIPKFLNRLINNLRSNQDDDEQGT